MPDTFHIVTDARLLTIPTARRSSRRGEGMSDLGVVERGWILVRDGVVAEVGVGTRSAPGHHRRARRRPRRHARVRRLPPARLLRGRSLGGVQGPDRRRDLRDPGVRWRHHVDGALGPRATEATLTDAARGAGRAARLGTDRSRSSRDTDSIETELKMLQAISAAAGTPQIVRATFLGAMPSTPTPRTPRSRDRGRRALPEVAASFPGIACDAYCEQGVVARPVPTTTRRRCAGCRSASTRTSSTAWG